MRRLVLILILVIVLNGCTAETVQPTNTPRPTSQPTNTPTTPPTAQPTNPPATATPLPAPPTFTPAPTKIRPTHTPTSVPTAEPTLAPTSVPTPTVNAVLGNCLPRDTIQNTQSPYAVTAAPWPRGNARAVEIYTGNVGPKLIHVGFDVEGDPSNLPEILDILDRHNVKATMFILGSWADTYPQWIPEFVARGHELANHTWTHGNMDEMSYETVQAELNRTEALVQKLVGQTTKPWLRPPFGARNETSIQASADAGWTTIVWSGSPDDWRTEYGVEEMCNTLLETSYPGGIIYMHPWRPEMPEVLDRYIGTLQTQGYTFVPLSVLMSSDPSTYLITNE